VPLAAKAAGAALVVAAVVGLGVLAWGLLAEGEAQETATDGSAAPPGATDSSVIGSFDDPNDFAGFLVELERAIGTDDIDWLVSHTGFINFQCDRGEFTPPDACHESPRPDPVRATIVSVFNSQGEGSQGFGAEEPDYREFLASFLNTTQVGAVDQYGPSEAELYAYGTYRPGLIPEEANAVAAMATRIPPDDSVPVGRQVLVFNSTFDPSRGWVFAVGSGSGASTVRNYLSPASAPEEDQLFSFWSPWPPPGGASPTP
jgi:hypothetical protein